MPKAKGSKWMQWQRAMFERKPVDDYVIDDDGTFYCVHDYCVNLDEHNAMNEAMSITRQATA